MLLHQLHRLVSNALDLLSIRWLVYNLALWKLRSKQSNAEGAVCFNFDSQSDHWCWPCGHHDCPFQNSQPQPQAMCLPPHPRWIQSEDAWLQHHACAGDLVAMSSMVQENPAALQPSHLVWVSPSTRLEVVRYWPQLPQDPRLVSKKTSLWQMEKVEKCWKSAHDQPISRVHVAVPLLPRIEWVSYLGITPALYWSGAISCSLCSCQLLSPTFLIWQQMPHKRK